jgi:hypothetical protein
MVPLSVTICNQQHQVLPDFTQSPSPRHGVPEALIRVCNPDSCTNTRHRTTHPQLDQQRPYPNSLMHQIHQNQAHTHSFPSLPSSYRLSRPTEKKPLFAAFGSSRSSRSSTTRLGSIDVNRRRSKTRGRTSRSSSRPDKLPNPYCHLQLTVVVVVERLCLNTVGGSI